MRLSIALASVHDEDFLWIMPYYAAHMQLEGASSPDSAKTDLYLQKMWLAGVSQQTWACLHMTTTPHRRGVVTLVPR